MNSPYSKTDKTIQYLNNRIPKLFRRTIPRDELNVIQISHEIYDEVYEFIEREATRLAEVVYRSYRKDDESVFDAAAFVLALLLAYNPVTKYVFKNEIDRKRSRFAESVLASDVPSEDIALAKRLLVAMTVQFMDDITFDALVKAYEDNGTTHVRWVTAEDDKRCKECRARHGKIYPIHKIPTKPHIHCRCWVEEVKK